MIAVATALLTAVALTPAVKILARRLGAVDQPGGRRVHVRDTPRMGGIAVVVGFVAGLGAAWWWATREGGAFEAATWPVFGYLAGGLFIAAVGARDDVVALGAKKKLAAQWAAATVAWSAGARIEAFDLPWIGDFEFGPVVSYLISVAWILAFVNAVNLIDGLDGLAGGIVLFAAITNTIVAYTTDNQVAFVLNGALGGAVLGFLFYNFNPATIFLGDTGSLFLGYSIGAAALLTGRQKESTVVSLLVPMVALGIPLTDTLLTMVRRFLSRRPIFSADRGHIHHRLLDLGLTHRRAVLLLHGSSVLTCIAALVAAFGKDWQAGVAIATATLVVLGAARFAGYFQFKVLRREPVATPAVDALRRALPRILSSTAADSTTFLREVAEQALAPGGAMRVELVGGPLAWSWGDEAAAMGGVVYELPVPGVRGTKWRVTYGGGASSASEKLEALLEVVVDAVGARLGGAVDPATSSAALAGPSAVSPPDRSRVVSSGAPSSTPSATVTGSRSSVPG